MAVGLAVPGIRKREVPSPRGGVMNVVPAGYRQVVDDPRGVSNNILRLGVEEMTGEQSAPLIQRVNTGSMQPRSWADSTPRVGSIGACFSPSISAQVSPSHYEHALFPPTPTGSVTVTSSSFSVRYPGSKQLTISPPHSMAPSPTALVQQPVQVLHSPQQDLRFALGGPLERIRIKNTFIDGFGEEGAPEENPERAVQTCPVMRFRVPSKASRIVTQDKLVEQRTFEAIEATNTATGSEALFTHATYQVPQNVPQSISGAPAMAPVPMHYGKQTGPVPIIHTSMHPATQPMVIMAMPAPNIHTSIQHGSQARTIQPVLQVVPQAMATASPSPYGQVHRQQVAGQAAPSNPSLVGMPLTQQAPRGIAQPTIIEPLGVRKPQASIGASLHGTGRCKPCAWFWKPQGCGNGATCQHCHLCPENELKNRKKARVTVLRNVPDGGASSKD